MKRGKKDKQTEIFK